MTTSLAAAFPAAPATTALIVAALLLAAALAVLAIRDQSTPRWALLGIAVLELILVVITVWCVVAWIGGNAPAEAVVFVFYLLACLAIPPDQVVPAALAVRAWGPCSPSAPRAAAGSALPEPT